jgi:hypothetical protein
LGEGSHSILFVSEDENGQVNTTENFTIDTTNPSLIDNHPIILQNATYKPIDYLNYSDDVNSCSYTLNNIVYNCTDSMNITTLGDYNYSVVVTDLAGNKNTTSGSYIFNVLVSIYIKDEDFNETLENTELNITGINFSHYSYSNPYQAWVSDLGNSINYSYIDKSGETINKNGSINFSTAQTEYYIYVENTPFKMYFYDAGYNNVATNFLILDSIGNIRYNESSLNAVYIQKSFAKGLVRAIFNWDNTTFEQQFQYNNDYTANINEKMLILPNINSVGFFKITDLYGLEIEGATIKLQARHQNETSPLLTTNQILTDDNGNGVMYYELGNGYYYWISVNAEGYVPKQIQIDLDNIENGNSNTPYIIQLEKDGTVINNGLSAYFNKEYTNTTTSIPMYFYTTKYDTIKFKTQYMADRGQNWITIPENTNLDNVFKYTMIYGKHYDLDGSDIIIYVNADGTEFKYTIKQESSDTQNIFGGLKNNTNEYLPLLLFIALLIVILGVRYQFQDDSMSVNLFFFGIVILSLIRQDALWGYIPLMYIGIYYLSKLFKKMGENTE